MAGAQLWQRSAAVTITKRGGSYAGKRLQNLRISFEATKTAGGDPDIHTVTVWNPSEDTVALATEKDKYLLLDIAYGADKMATLLEGDIVSAQLEPAAPDRKLVIKVGDGYEASKQAGTRAWNPGTSYAQIAQDIANEMKNAKGIIVKGIKDAFSSPEAKAKAAEAAVNGYAINGNLMKKLAELGDERDVDTDLSDGAISGVLKNGYTGKAILLTPNTGLLGYPVREYDKKDKRDYIIAKCLIISTEMRPHSLFKIDCAAMKVDITAKRIAFQGDTHGNDWTATITGVPI